MRRIVLGILAIMSGMALAVLFMLFWYLWWFFVIAVGISLIIYSWLTDPD